MSDKKRIFDDEKEMPLASISAVRQARASEAARAMQQTAKAPGLDGMSQADIEDEIRQSRATRRR